MSAQPESVPRCLDPKIDIRVAALGRLWSAPEAVQRVTTRFSNRLVHCLGRANATRGTISLAPALQSDPALLDQALTHELAHIVAFRLVGKTEPAHGPTWQRLMRLAGYEPSIRLAAPTWVPPNIDKRVPLEVYLVPEYLAAIGLFLVLLAAVAAVLPARRASRLSIIDALGHV